MRIFFADDDLMPNGSSMHCAASELLAFVQKCEGSQARNLTKSQEDKFFFSNI